MNPSYYVDGGPDAKNIHRFREWFYQSNYTQNVAAQQQANIDARFKAGDQRINGWNALGNLGNQRNLYFNQIQRHINLMTGHQRQNRKSSVALGVHADADALANDCSELLRFVERTQDFQELHSDCFDACVTQGQALMEIMPDYTHDPYVPDFRYNIVTRVNYLIDVNFKRMDLSDCQGIWRRSWIGKEAAKQALPGREKEIDKLRPVGYKDSKFPLQAELQNLDISNLHCYDEFHYLDTREALMIEDPINGESYEFIKRPWEDEDTLDRILFEQPWLKVKKRKKPTTKLCIFLDNRLMYEGPNLLGIDRYPFAPYMCYFERDLNYSYRERGVTRDLRDPQWLLNRIRILQLEMLESQPNSGWIYPVDAVVDERAFRQTLNGVLVPLKKGHTHDEIKKIETAHIDPSIFQLSELLFQDFEKISGINSELFGIGEDDAAGILALMRRASGVVTLQSIFDKLDFSQKLVARIMLEAIQMQWTPEKCQRILGRPIDEKFFYKSITHYNIAVEEGPYSATQRQTEFKQLLYLKQALNVPVSNKLLIQKSMVFDKEAVYADMAEQEQQQAQQMQAQQAMEQQKTMAQNMESIAKTKVDLARARDLQLSAAEREAKIQDLLASAEKKEASSDLDIVEKLIKLEDMSFNQLKNSFELAQNIKNQNAGGQNGKNEVRPRNPL